MTIRKTILEDNPIEGCTVMATIKNKVIDKSREGRIVNNDPKINDSYRRARLFIYNFSMRIF
jgi:hypothetical protein